MKSKTAAIILPISILLAACGSFATPAPTLDVNAVNTAIVGTTVAQLSGQFTQTALAAPTNTPASIETLASVPTLALPTLAGDISSGTSPTVDAAALPTFSFVTTPGTNNTITSGLTPFAGVTPLATAAQNISSGQPASTASGCNDSLFVTETLPDGSSVVAGNGFTKAWEIKNTGTCTWNAGYTFAFLPDVSNSAIKGYDITIKTTDTFTKPGHSQSFIVKLTAPSASGEYKAYWKMKDGTGNYFGSRVYFDIIVKQP